MPTAHISSAYVSLIIQLGPIIIVPNALQKDQSGCVLLILFVCISLQDQLIEVI